LKALSYSTHSRSVQDKSFWAGATGMFTQTASNNKQLDFGKLEFDLVILIYLTNEALIQQNLNQFMESLALMYY
jgi:hypothetical protein